MANYSDLTRKEQVLRRLQDANGEWVDGTDIANETVGGSEGLRRLRELQADGHVIHMRRHPDPTRSVWQYRLAHPQTAVSPLRGNATVQPIRRPKLVFGEVSLCWRCDGKGGSCGICQGRGWL